MSFRLPHSVASNVEIHQGFKVALGYHAHFVKQYKGEVRKLLGRVATLTRQVTTKHLLTAIQTLFMCLVIALKRPYGTFIAPLQY